MYDYPLQVTTYISLIGSNKSNTYIPIYSISGFISDGMEHLGQRIHYLKWFYIKVRNVSADQFRKCLQFLENLARQIRYSYCATREKKALIEYR
jgi:hypothetical protein